MTLDKFASKLDLVVNVEPAENKEITGCYIGDLLSWVMSKAEEGQAWLTIMGNPNVIAVARLTDVSCVILCENAPLDDNALEHARSNKIAVFTTDKTAYKLALEIGKLLEQ